MLAKLAAEPGKLLNAGALEKLAAQIPAAGAGRCCVPFFAGREDRARHGIGETFLIGASC